MSTISVVYHSHGGHLAVGSLATGTLLTHAGMIEAHIRTRLTFSVALPIPRCLRTLRLARIELLLEPLACLFRFTLSLVRVSHPRRKPAAHDIVTVRTREFGKTWANYDLESP